MSRLLFGAVLPLLICVFVPKAAFLQQDIYCRDHLEYQHAGICCLNCPAGKRLVSPCKTAGTRGVCVECDDGTYTEHANSLRQCFKCTQCRRDQDIVRACSHTLDTECQCKPGKFCAPDQACEVCKKCTRCDQDEEIVRNCTPTANRECKKIQAKSVTPGVKASVIVLISLFAVAVLAVIVVLVWRHHRATGSRHLSEDLKAEKPFGDFHPTAEVWNGETHRPSCSSLILPRQLEDEQLPKLVAVNGEESLRKCFCYFEEIDVNYHKRFFRHLGISDNMIKGKENLPYEDRIHDLLNIWIEKAGKEADLNDLLQVLLDLNQRRTAEQIKEHAIHHGHYFSEEM